MRVKVELENVAAKFAPRMGQFIVFDAVVYLDDAILFVVKGCRTFKGKLQGPALKLESGAFMMVLGWGRRAYELAYDALLSTQVYQDAVLRGLQPLQAPSEPGVAPEDPRELLNALKPRKGQKRTATANEVPTELFH